MSKSNDRIEFYEQLDKCNSKGDIEDLIEMIENVDLLDIIEDKYKKILEYNQDEDIKNIIKILEFTYLKFEKEQK